MAFIATMGKNDDFRSTQIMWEEFHEPLNIFQATPIIGPLVGSPVKLVISIIQAVVAGIFGLLELALTGFLRICGKKDARYWETCGVFRERLYSNSHEVLDEAKLSGLHVLMGVSGAFYSVANIATIGGLGFALEMLDLKSTISPARRTYDSSRYDDFPEKWD